jgi:GNAT superfamily N-acetyltransferase
MIAIRYANASDLRFVRDSWFESYRRGGFAPEIGFDLFSEGQRKLIATLTHPSNVRVACAENTPDEILGWVCFEGATVHYVYVKSAYRKLGCAEGLLEDVREVTEQPSRFYSHQTRAGIQLAKKLGLRYNPYLTMKGNP